MKNIVIKDMKLLEQMILSNKFKLHEISLNDPCIFPTGWNEESSKKFRTWFRDKYPVQAKQFKIDETGQYDFKGLCTAYYYKPYGNETAGYQWSNLRADQGGGMEPPSTYFGLTSGEWVTIVAIAAGVIIGGIIAFKGAAVLIGKGKAALKSLGIDLSRKNYVDYKLLIDALKDPEKLKKLEQSIENSKLTAEEKTELKNLFRNRTTRISAINGWTEEILTSFKAGHLTADQTISLIGDQLDAKYIAMIRAIEQNRINRTAGVTPPAKSGTTSPNFLNRMRRMRSDPKFVEKLANMSRMKMKPVTPDNPNLFWAEDGSFAKFASINYEFSEIQAAIAKAAKSYKTQINPMGVKTQSEFNNMLSDAATQLKTKLESYGGYKMLAQHAEVHGSSFPTFKDWKFDRGTTMPSTLKRYIQDKAMHDLVHSSV